MGELLLLIPLCVLVYISYKNIRLLKRVNHNKEYVECYKQILNDTYGSYERVSTYVKEENSAEFANKGRILKLYVELCNHLEYEETLEQLKMEEIFYQKQKLQSEKVAMNSDVFIWIFIVMAKAREISKFDVLHRLKEKLEQLPEMEEYLEYRESKAIYNALCEQEDGGTAFLHDLLEGEYYQLKYEKSLIGLYKRFASATLAYSGEPIEDYYRDDLHDFASTQIGKTYMKALNIYEKYPPIQAEEEEEKSKE